MLIRTLVIKDRIQHYVTNCGASKEEAMMMVIGEQEMELHAVKNSLAMLGEALGSSMKEEFYSIKNTCARNRANRHVS
jgi:hypothetical protein